MRRLWRTRVFPFLLILLLFLSAVWIGRSIYDSKYSLTCASYRLTTDKVEKTIRLVQISDLHNRVFGERNQELINLVAGRSPDLILITGDLMNAEEDGTEIAADLISSLGRIAPVYASLGNHEIEYGQNKGIDIVGLYEAAGAVVLDRQFQEIEVNGQKIRLGGIYGYCLPEKYLATQEASPSECAFLSDFQNTELYTVLMCHIPVGWLINGGLDEWNVDCVLSGHLHGGQVILPLIGGVYAPDLGWFPGRLKGLYFSEDRSSALILTAGLGNTEAVPRFNNIPEIVSTDIIP